MKVFCSSNNKVLKKEKNTDLKILLFGRSSNDQSIGSIGAAVYEEIKRNKIKPSSRAWDILSFALSVIAADTGVFRNESPDGWTRVIDLKIAVSDVAFWNNQKELVEKFLKLLTTDLWTLEFVDGGFLPKPAKPISYLKSDCVVLLSGGLDSLVGAIDLSKDNQNPLAVSQVSSGDKHKQKLFASTIGGGLKHLQFNHNVFCPDRHELSQRARSIIFLAYGVLAATTLEKFNDGQKVDLNVCENGFISINPPLTGSRLGSLSTRTTHPNFIELFQQLIDNSGLKVRITNPYQFKTKGEMLKECLDQDYLKINAATSTSCGKFIRTHKHCGHCLPCLIRRAAFNAWGEKDTTEYRFDDLSIDDSNHALYDDVRCAAMAVADVKLNGFNNWFNSALSTLIFDDTLAYEKVVKRGLNELGAFLTSAGVK